MVNALITVILFLLLIFSGSCGVNETVDENPIPDNSNSTISIADIISDPEIYEGKTVILNGEYRGWESGYGTAPVTRSDWVLKDATGAIYVTGLVPSGLDPVDDRGTEVIVHGIVKIKDNQAYIQATEIK